MTTAEICNAFSLTAEARQAVAAASTPKQVLAVLAEKQLLTDALQFVAHALPKRQAVWWAAKCVRQVNPAPPPEAAAALDAAEKWIAEPTDEHRKAAMDAANKAELSTPAGCTGLAAFYSSGLGPDPKAEFMTAKAAGAAVLMAATAGPPESVQTHFREFLTKGIELVNRTHP
ncbi:MAG TPA: hypothetical protein VMZ52_01690 [Bryobacteraceae bacterium]|nr:hypothetical protein [Bryobacteraceae bacterium]